MTDFLIVGGGIIGLLTAHELLNAGASVTLIERGKIAQESSWAGGGIISPLYPWRYLDSVNDLAKHSQLIYPDLCADLTEKTGIDPELTNSGLLVISDDEKEESSAWAKQYDMEISFVDHSEAKKIEPEMIATNRDAMWLPTINQVRNPRITKALAKKIRSLGATVHEDTELSPLRTSNRNITRFETSNGVFSADKTIVCSGAWTGEIFDNKTIKPAIKPVRGQMIMFQTAPGTISRIVLEDNRYIIPRQDGKVLFGSTIEHVGYVKQTTEEAFAELHDIATTRFPVLKQAKVIHHWAGLRPGSPAGVPYIAAHTGYENIFVNAGHFRNGVVLGPASARLMADLVLDRTPVVDPSPYTLEAGRG